MEQRFPPNLLGFSFTRTFRIQEWKEINNINESLEVFLKERLFHFIKESQKIILL